MELDLIQVAHVLRRWAWMIITVAVITVLVTYFSLRSSSAVYEASIRLQVTTPQREDIDIYDQYRFISDRDEVTIARNNLVEIINSHEVNRATLTALELQDIDYSVSVNLVRDADFVDVIIEAPTANLASTIANAHVEQSIIRIGELNALPSQIARNQLANELETTQQEIEAAEIAFNEFLISNNITDLDQELRIQQQVLEQLEIEKNDRLVAGSLSQASREESVGAVDTIIAQKRNDLAPLLKLRSDYNLLEFNLTQAQDNYQRFLSSEPEVIEEDEEVVDSQALDELVAAEKALSDFRSNNDIAAIQNDIEITQNLISQLTLDRDRIVLEETVDQSALIEPLDSLIISTRQRLSELQVLEPQFNLLSLNADQSREKYELIREKYTEADLKEKILKDASYIQVIAPAQIPDNAESNLSTIILATVGSIGFGVLLAFLLEYFSNFQAVENLGGRKSTTQLEGS